MRVATYRLAKRASVAPLFEKKSYDGIVQLQVERRSAGGSVRSLDCKAWTGNLF